MTDAPILIPPYTDNGMSAAWLAIGISFGILLSAQPSEPPKPWVPPHNPELLQTLKDYCQRYQKQPYIDSCIEDRARRNLISSQ